MKPCDMVLCEWTRMYYAEYSQSGGEGGIENGYHILSIKKHGRGKTGGPWQKRLRIGLWNWIELTILRMGSGLLVIEPGLTYARQELYLFYLPCTPEWWCLYEYLMMFWKRLEAKAQYLEWSGNTLMVSMDITLWRHFGVCLGAHGDVGGCSWLGTQSGWLLVVLWSHGVPGILQGPPAWRTHAYLMVLSGPGKFL